MNTSQVNKNNHWKGLTAKQLPRDRAEGAKFLTTEKKSHESDNTSNICWCAQSTYDVSDTAGPWVI